MAVKMQRTSSTVATSIVLLLMSCFLPSEAAWFPNPLATADGTKSSLGMKSPFVEVSELSHPWLRGLLGRKGALDGETDNGVKGISVDQLDEEEPEDRGREGGWFGFLGFGKKDKPADGGEDATQGAFPPEREGAVEGRPLFGNMQPLLARNKSAAPVEREEESGMQVEDLSTVEVTAESANLTDLVGPSELGVEKVQWDGSARNEEQEQPGSKEEGEPLKEGRAGWGWFASQKPEAKAEQAGPSRLQAAVMDTLAGPKAKNSEPEKLGGESKKDQGSRFGITEDGEEERGLEREGALEAGEEKIEVAAQQEGKSGPFGLQTVNDTESAERLTAAELRAVIVEAVALATNGSNATVAEAAKQLIWELFQGAGTEHTKPGLVSSEDGVMTNSTLVLQSLNASVAVTSDNATEGWNVSTSVAIVPSNETSLIRNSSKLTAVGVKKQKSFWASLLGGREDETQKSSEDGREELSDSDQELLGELGSRNSSGETFATKVGSSNVTGGSQVVNSQAFQISGAAEELGVSEGEMDESWKAELAAMLQNATGGGMVPGLEGNALEHDSSTLMSSNEEQTQGNGGEVDAAANETLDVDLQTYIETMKNNTRLAMKNITRLSLQKLLGNHHNSTAKPYSGSTEEALSQAPLNDTEARTKEQSLAGNKTGFEENPKTEGYVIDTGVQGAEPALAGNKTGLEANTRFRADETGNPQGGGGSETNWSPSDESEEDYDDEYEGAPFFNNLFNAQTLGAVQEKAKAHLVPQVQALSQATTGAYNSTHKQIKASLEGVVGPGASAATATVLVLLLLLVPGAAVVLICKRIKAVFSLQTVLFVSSSYFSLYSLALTLIALTYKEPLGLFQRNSPEAYVIFQFLSLLAYVIFLVLCAVSSWAALKTAEPLQKALGGGQVLPAFGVGLHYFGTVWQPAMLDKAPHLKWTAYGVYTVTFVCICSITWFRRSRHEVLAAGGSTYKQL